MEFNLLSIIKIFQKFVNLNIQKFLHILKHIAIFTFIFYNL